MAVFDMLDLTFEEFDKLYQYNKTFFWEIKNWFYFKNDKEPSLRSGRVRCGPISGLRYEGVYPQHDYGAAVLLCTTSDTSNLRTECEKSEDGLVRFKLKDGESDAYLGIIKNPDGTESAGLVIKNNPKTMSLPFSTDGKTTYGEASKEENTLPWMVENDMFVEMIPDEILELIGLKEKPSKKELLEELAEIDKELIALRIQQQKLEEKKTAVVEQVVILNDGTDDGIDK